MNTIDPHLARAFPQRLHAAVNAHDALAIAALCRDDVVWQDPAAPATLHGRDAVLRFHRDVMFPALPDVRVESIDGPWLAADGLGVAVRLRIRGTMTGALTPPGFAPTGGTLIFETAEFSRLDASGLLAQHTVVLDMLDLARQIGAVPRSGSVGARVGLWMQHAAAFRARAQNRREASGES